MEFAKQAHCTYYARYHLVFVTKYRRKLLKQGMGAYLVRILHNITKQYPEVHILTANTDEDHVHLFVSIPPKFAVSTVVGYMKGRSAYAMRKKFSFLKLPEYRMGQFWSDGYFVSTVGADEETIRRYIEHQGREDHGQALLVL